MCAAECISRILCPIFFTLRCPVFEEYGTANSTTTTNCYRKKTSVSEKVHVEQAEVWTSNVQEKFITIVTGLLRHEIKKLSENMRMLPDGEKE